MKVLVFNGSPRGENSKTMYLTRAFLEGMKRHEPIEEEILPVYEMDIQPCKGCFGCWTATPGKCCIKDDMPLIIEKILAADVIIWSFPLYFFSLPSQLKALTDRQLPVLLPYMTGPTDGGSYFGAHPMRFEMKPQRIVLISTCGFYTAAGNYEAVKRQYEREYGKENCEMIFCGQGGVFGPPPQSDRVQQYLGTVRQAGYEFMDGAIAAETKEKLSELLFPREQFEQSANASWQINDGAAKSAQD